MYREIAQQLASDFQENPINYVAEADLQISLVNRLRAMLKPRAASVERTDLEGTSDDSFKRDYWQTVQQRLTEEGQLGRVHAEVSVQQGERLDVAVFDSELTHPVQWISGGSKRFSENDIDCIYELKFVKNKTSFPKHSGNPVDEVAAEFPTVSQMLYRDEHEQPLLDFSENKIAGDICELNRLNEANDRFLLLFSNNNYLYDNPTKTELDSYKYGELYRRMGKAAEEWMKREANEKVDILYVHPRGESWITD